MPSEGGRTSLGKAVETLLDKIPLDRPITPYELQELSNLSWHTILKSAQLIVGIQNRLLKENVVLDLRKEKGKYVISARRRNLLSLPVEERLRYVRARYFPEPDTQDYLLAELYRLGATVLEKAIPLKRDTLLEELLAQETLTETEDGRIYLTEEGAIIARGVLKMYPELSVSSRK